MTLFSDFKEYRDNIIGHSMKRKDVHYLKPSENDLKEAMGIYTGWLDEHLTASLAHQKIANT